MILITVLYLQYFYSLLIRLRGITLLSDLYDSSCGSFDKLFITFARALYEWSQLFSSSFTGLGGRADMA